MVEGAKTRNVTTGRKKVGTLPIIIGLDVGFGSMKYLSNLKPKPEVIPSAVAEGTVSSSRLFNYSEIDTEHLIVTTNDGTYFVGDSAMYMPNGESKRTRIRDRAADPLSRVLFQTGIGLSVPDKSGEYDVYVVTGLPNNDYEKKIRENLQAFLEKSFEISFNLSKDNAITKKINVKGVEILRQPEGTVTYNQFNFDPQHFLVASEKAQNYLGVIDFGHYTTDYAMFRDGVIIEDNTVNNSTVGVVQVYDKLRSKLEVFFGDMGVEFKATDRSLDEVIRTGKIRFAGQDHDVSDLVREASEEVAAIIGKNILESWGTEANYLDVIIAAGGGAEVFGEIMKKIFEENKRQGFDVVQAPQFTNVLGFYMYGVISAGDREDQKKVYDTYVKPVFEIAA
jgi:hypothetical protein